MKKLFSLLFIVVMTAATTLPVQAEDTIRVSKNAISGPKALTGFWIQYVEASSLMPEGSVFPRKCSPPGLLHGGPWHSS